MTRKTFLSMQITLDGYIAGPNGQPEFAQETTSDELLTIVVDLLKASDTMLLGRVAWEEQSGYWPTASGDQISPLINPIEKVVFSSTKDNVDGWSNSRIARSIPEEMKSLRARGGGDIFVSGGQRLAQSLLREGELDELYLYVHPVTVGTGLPLFLNETKLELLDAKPLPNGVVFHHYRVRK